MVRILSHANLHRARLRSKSMTRANLNGADLRGTGLSEQEVRAATDQVEGTKFGPHPDDSPMASSVALPAPGV
ncbi:pentapeptide repeat-containing protein [Herbidospora cretacea]|uniref:pentapeptide repeat-containing protein n=1 Tax=Herbidospora cretacea TaxID=28444 RepID=UPI0009E0418C